MYFCIITYIHKLSSVLTWNRHKNVAELTSQWHPNLPLLCICSSWGGGEVVASHIYFSCIIYACLS